MTLSNTKTIRSAYQRYLTSSYGNNLYKCYAHPSYAKFDAMDYCNALCREMNGRDLRIISYNVMVFTVGFIFTDEDGRECFAYITRDHDRYMKL